MRDRKGAREGCRGGREEGTGRRERGVRLINDAGEIISVDVAISGNTRTFKLHRDKNDDYSYLDHVIFLLGPKETGEGRGKRRGMEFIGRRSERREGGYEA
jgi:hypothetical protein